MRKVEEVQVNDLKARYHYLLALTQTQDLYIDEAIDMIKALGCKKTKDDIKAIIISNVEKRIKDENI